MRRQKRIQAKREQRGVERKEQLTNLGVLILAMLAPDRTWLPHFMAQFELTAERAEFEDALCAQFLGMADDAIANALTPETLEGKAQLRRAHNFVTQVRLKTWVEEQNNEKIVPPSIGDAIRKREELMVELTADDEDGTPAFSTKSAARYRWMRRFRNKWRAKMRKPQEREQVPLETARVKVNAGKLYYLRKKQHPKGLPWAVDFLAPKTVPPGLDFEASR